ncbi:MAG TPA: glycine/betaine ABC transporter substrate-binding protein [Halomonas sp.]|jgi:glycine betaine/proline transport system substrate-binding protein|uniref:ABC-type glycine betaine transport system substrate-binding domain-containing protein n=1 Tax=Vreelandella aquamarina TaxID=77097 RepID=A0A6F8SX53_9GAMM|nr:MULTISPECIES: glycine betaine ABC transporter substrate-binding protein [Halomonas]KTG26500.1 glycine/betaine ABC transporter substrate-binding protein [Idiomarina sp. H105]MED5557056.1 glycine betaine ABC transporter substrate-binding protein [Pseudomonadota bacterium]OAE98901.1 glycine/betaine ABC transporter substrate-binding protein [Idiomarina sp. WRN-38]MDK2752059.1 glycine betaine ABC transporter substrate-binding protein [Halomonas meridiana]NQY77078.1 glycine betaine ABC transporte|tara:strand:- start:65 stop:937 length:873 start_codon:yes stop_codon:yes gene_type:complete
MKTRTLNHRIRLASLALFAGTGLAAGSMAHAQDQGTVNLAYVEWSSEVASTNVIAAVLEQAGFEVELTSLSAAAMFQALSTGDADAIVAAWLPTTHAEYMERVGDNTEDLGPNLDGTKLGLVVPEYTDVDSIADLNDNADSFNGEIIGIDPGAGLMALTEEVVDTYDLGLNLRSGSGATMTAALASAIQNEEDVVVTGWTPHWMFARFDLKYLEDPENVYGGAEQIHTVVRSGLEEDMPEAYAILDAFEWTPEQMGEVMLMNQEDGSDPYENAKQWVEENQDVVEQWLNG